MASSCLVPDQEPQETIGGPRVPSRVLLCPSQLTKVPFSENGSCSYTNFNRKKIAFRWLFQDRDLLGEVEESFVEFSCATGRFGGYDVVGDKGVKMPYNWWETHEAPCPILQNLALMIISQVTSFVLFRGRRRSG